MSVPEQIAAYLDRLPADQQQLILELARFLSARAQDESWRAGARAQFARAYGDAEPDYTPMDVKPELNA